LVHTGCGVLRRCAEPHGNAPLVTKKRADLAGIIMYAFLVIADLLAGKFVSNVAYFVSSET